MKKLPPQVNTVLQRLNAAGYEAFLVGGAVRDFVRDGSPAKDWDVATNALPEQVERVFQGFRLIETGLKHGTVTVLLDRVPVEITTYRVDGAYSDYRHPDSVRFTRSLKDDLERRDFTMNALAYSPKTGLVDLVGGRDDIAQGRIRCVGEPDRRFREDGLRMLRALRFSATLGMTIEKETAAAIRRNQDLLRKIAPERIQTELTKLLCGKEAGRILSEFAGVVAVPIPEAAASMGFQQRSPYHVWDVWEHTAVVVDNVPPEPVLRWAALLHDLGKPACFSLDGSGVGHFYGHGQKSAELTERILGRLRFDTKSRERIVRLVRYHDAPIQADKKLLRRLLNKHGEEAARQLLALHRADTLGQAEICRPRLAELEAAGAMLEALLKEESCFSLKDLAVNGRDMLAMGLRGEAVGRALQACLEAVLDETVENDRQALLALVRERKQ